MNSFPKLPRCPARSAAFGWLVLSGMLLLLPGRSLAQIQAFMMCTNNAQGPSSRITNVVSTAANGWIQIPSMSVDVRTNGTGGTIIFDPLSIQRAIDSFSPTLFASATGGSSPGKWAYLAFCRIDPSSGGAFEFFRITMYSVFTPSQGFSFDGNTITENDTFIYQAMAITFTAQNPDGSTGMVTTKGWDKKSNKSWDGSSIP